MKPQINKNKKILIIIVLAIGIGFLILGFSLGVTTALNKIDQNCTTQNYQPYTATNLNYTRLGLDFNATTLDPPNPQKWDKKGTNGTGLPNLVPFFITAYAIRDLQAYTLPYWTF